MAASGRLLNMGFEEPEGLVERAGESRQNIGRVGVASFIRRGDAGPHRIRGGAIDHDDFGLSQSKIMNVIDSKSLERDADGKPCPLFLIPL